MIRTAISWSSGKDSAWMLYQLQQDPNIEIIELVTTVNQIHQRVAMHAVRIELLKLQATAIGLPLRIIDLPYPCTNEQYERIMQNYIDSAVKKGIKQMAFGDLFLQDIRDYRIKQLASTQIKPIFPIWKIPTNQLIKTMLSSGLRALTTCIDPKQVDASFIGREIDQGFIDELPESVDPCGENGEFHSFVYDGPMFNHPLSVEVGEIVERDGFVFADLIKT